MNPINYYLKSTPFFLLIVCICLTKLSFAQTLQPPVKQLSYNERSQYHDADFGEDWFYSVIQTSDGSYIGTGYSEYPNTTAFGTNAIAVYNTSIVKLDHSGKKLWETVFPSTTNNEDLTEYGNDVIETPDCYAVLATLYDFHYPNKTLCILKFDKSTGALIGSPIDLYHGGSNYATIRKVTDQAEIYSGYIIGNTVTSSGNPSHAAFIKLNDDFSLDNDFGSSGVSASGENNSSGRNATVVHDASGNVIGYALIGEDRNTASIIDGYADGYLVYCNPDGSFNRQWKITEQSILSNTNISGGYTDATNFHFLNAIDQTETEFGASVENYTVGGNYLIANFDFNVLEYTGTFDNGFTNQWLTGGYANSADPAHGGDLQNRDQALLKFDLNASSTTHGSFPDYGDIVWATNPAQFSGVDFYDPLHIEPNGDIVILGNDATETDKVKIELVKCSQSDGSLIWKRSFLSNDNLSDPYSGQNENCVWGFDLTSDGGYIIGGTNGINDEDYFMVKLAPDCQPNISYTGSDDVASGYSLTADETWSTSRKVKGTIDIPSGNTLTISGSSTVINFADNWRTLDYDFLAQNTFNYEPSKIVVEPGGKLIVDGATLRGMDACGGADGDMWWKFRSS